MADDKDIELGITYNAQKGIEGIEKTEKALGDLDKAAKRTQQEFDKTGKAAKDAGGGFQSLIQSASGLAGVAAAAGALGGAIVGTAAKGLSAFREWESAFAGVKKTVDASEEGFVKLEGELRQIAKTSPLSATEIANVAQSAGALGIATKDVASFTKTMAVLGATTDLSAGAAADSIARLNNIMGDAPDAGQWQNLGSALLYLGNTSAATESQIINMATSVSAAGSQANMTQASVLGIAAALSSVGLQAQGGGTAISRLIINMQTAVETGDKTLKVYEEMYAASGKVVQGQKTFAEAFKKDSAEALAAFFEGMNKASGAGRSQLEVLKDLGISEVRLRDTILRASEASGLFAKSISDARMAAKDGEKANEAFAKRTDTLDAKLKILQNRMRDAWISVGKAFQPIAKLLLEGLNVIALGITKLADFFAGLPKAVHFAIAGIGAFALALASAAGALAAFRAAGSVVPIVLETIGRSSPRLAEALAQLTVAGKLDMSRGITALKDFASALSFKGVKLVGRDEITGRFKAMEQGALTLGQLTTNLRTMAVEAVKAGASTTWGWLKQLPGMFTSAAGAAKSGLGEAIKLLTSDISKLPAATGALGVAGAVAGGVAIAGLVDSLIDASEASENLTIKQQATATMLDKTSTAAERQAAQMKLVRVNLEEATAKVGLVEGGMSLLKGVLDSIKAPEWLTTFAEKMGPLGPLVKDLYKNLLELIPGFGVFVTGREKVEKLGNALYGAAPPASQLAAAQRDLAKASEISGQKITDWGEAQKIIADQINIERQIRANIAAIQQQDTAMAKAIEHGQSYLKHIAEETLADMTKGMTEEQKKAWAGVDPQELLGALEGLKDKQADATTGAKALNSALEEQKKKAQADAEEIRKLADSMRGVVPTDEIRKTEAALALVGGAAKLSEEAVLQYGASFAKAAATGATFHGELGKLVARYAEVQQAALRAQIAGKMSAADLKSFREWAAALEKVGAANIPTDKLEEFSKKLREGLDNGVALEAEGWKVIEAWNNLDATNKKLEEFKKKALEDADAAKAFLAAMDPKVLAASFDKVMQLVDLMYVKVDDDLTKANDAILIKSYQMLVELQKEYAAAGEALPKELFEKLFGVSTELANRLKAGAPAVREFFGEGTTGANEAAAATFSWNDALSITAHIMDALGIDAQSTFGKIVAGIQGVMASLEQIKKFSPGGKGGIFAGLKGLFGKEGLKGGLEQRMAAGGAIGSLLGSASSLFGGQKTTGGRMLGGAAMGAQIGAIAGPWGMAAGAVAGAIIGAFKKPSWVKVGKDAGKVLGTNVSEELAKSIEQTKKQLKVSTAAAALLHLDEAVKESGKSWNEFGGQVSALQKGIADGTIPMKEGLQQVSAAWAGVREEAELTNKVGDKLTRQMIEQGKATGTLTKEMKEFLRAAGQSAASAAQGLTGLLPFGKDEEGKMDFSKMLEGFKPMSQEQGKAVAGVFIAAFNTAVGELGVVEATDTMREGFEQMRDGLKGVFGEEFARQLFAPIAGMFDLTKEGSPFRGAAMAGDSLEKIFKAVADTGRLTADSFKDFGTTAKMTYDQAIAAHADEKTALSTILPYLQDAVSASKEYGFTLDANTQGLVDQAKAAGFAFPEDAPTRMANAVDKLVYAMNKAFNLGMDLPDPFNAATAAANGTAAAAAGVGTAAAGAAASVADSYSSAAEAGKAAFRESLTASKAAAKEAGDGWSFLPPAAALEAAAQAKTAAEQAWNAAKGALETAPPAVIPPVEIPPIDVPPIDIIPDSTVAEVAANLAKISGTADAELSKIAVKAGDASASSSGSFAEMAGKVSSSLSEVALSGDATWAELSGTTTDLADTIATEVPTALDEAMKRLMELRNEARTPIIFTTQTVNQGSGPTPPGGGGPGGPPQMQHGGVVNAPTSGMSAILHGPEAVIPLDKLDNMLARNGGGSGAPPVQNVQITTTAPLTLNQNPFLAADTQDEANRRIVGAIVDALQRRDSALIGALPVPEPVT